MPNRSKIAALALLAGVFVAPGAMVAAGADPTRWWTA